MSNWPTLPSPKTYPLARPQPFLYLSDRARRQPARAALVTAERTLSFRDVHEHAVRIAHELRRRGVQPGQVVITDLTDELNVIFMEALFHEGAIAGIYLGALSEALTLGVDWLIVLEPAPEWPPERTIVVDDDFLQSAATRSRDISPYEYDGWDAPIRLVFSSGTTGVPAAVPWSIAITEGRRRVATETWSTTRPFMSLVRPVGGLGFLAAYRAVADGDAYLTPGTTPEVIELLHDNYVAHLQASPIQLAQIIQYLEATNQSLPDLAVIQCVGSHLAPALARRLHETLAASLWYTYGSTEAGMVSVHENYDGVAGDVGVPLAHVELQIVDDDDQPLPDGETGEVRYRGPYMPERYFREDLVGRSLRRDGWIHPGDLGRLGSDGRLTLMGRVTEVINAGGVKLNPAKIDDFVIQQPGVRDAAAFPFEVEMGVSGYAVAVVCDADVDVSALAEPIARAFENAAPRYLVRVNEVKRNPTGKIERAVMANDLAALLRRR